MLKCSTCGRAGGPFRLRHQIRADGQILRAWLCPCGHQFHTGAGAERTAAVQPPYLGFSLDWHGHPASVRLLRMSKQEVQWRLGLWTLTVNGPPSGPGTRVVTLRGELETVIGEWRLEPSWGPTEVGRRLRAVPLPREIDPDLLGRVIMRVLN